MTLLTPSLTVKTVRGRNHWSDHEGVGCAETQSPIVHPVQNRFELEEAERNEV